ncbi:MAG: FliI/YscN family ATPase [Firmicutes bacterium]|nr:FliI/YscN family ATPase [Bacillota bacterium]
MNHSPEKLQAYHNRLARTRLHKVNGRVEKVIGLTVESRGPVTKIGDVCLLHGDGESALCEVVGFRQDLVVLMPLGDIGGLAPGSIVEATGESLQVTVGEGLLGRVLDGLGQPIDGLGPLSADLRVPISRDPPPPLSRPLIRSVMATGVRVIDGLLTLGRGQRVGLFAGSGVGKSTLLGMIARNSDADVNVIALIGERGREVREFIEKDLGSAIARSVVVVATSDQPPLTRIKGAFVATAIAEYFREAGKDVTLMMDSVTRFAMALREQGLAIGEPPTARGYTPSVFAALPKLLERAGTAAHGSITGIYTVLVDGDDMQDPIADAVRGILDGHIVLSRDLANRGHFPSVDPLQSVSRLMHDIVSEQQRKAASRVRAWMAAKRDAEDLIRIGAYQRGSDYLVDEALEAQQPLADWLCQNVDETSSFLATSEALMSLTKVGEPE